MAYFEFLYGFGIICLPLNIRKNCIDNISSKSQKRQRFIAFILVNTIQHPRTLKSNIYHSNKRVPPRFINWIRILCLATLWSTNLTKPMFWLEQWNWFGCFDLVVALEHTFFFQLCSSAEQISVSLARFRRTFEVPKSDKN